MAKFIVVPRVDTFSSTHRLLPFVSISISTSSCNSCSHDVLLRSFVICRVAKTREPHKLLVCALHLIVRVLNRLWHHTIHTRKRTEKLDASTSALLSIRMMMYETTMYYIFYCSSSQTIMAPHQPYIREKKMKRKLDASTSLCFAFNSHDDVRYNNVRCNNCTIRTMHPLCRKTRRERTPFFGDGYATVRRRATVGRGKVV